MQYRDEVETARDLARRAAALALELQGKVAVRDKGGGEGPVTDADLAVERVLLDGLSAAFPDDPVLSEETRTDTDVVAPRLWCVDPIDGTREYCRDRVEFAVQVGLLVRGEPVAGAVALPGIATVLWGARGEGAFVEDADGTRPIRLAACRDLAEAVAVHTRSRRSARLDRALARLGVRAAFAAGSVGFKVGALLRGQAQLYLHTGPGLSWWDTVAPVAILLAAGGTATRIDGSPLGYGDGATHSGGMVLAVPGLAPLAAERLAGAE